MKRNWTWFVALACVFAFLAARPERAVCEGAAAQVKKIRVLVVTGGHDFEKEPFFAMFKAMDAIVCETGEQKETSEAYNERLSSKYDVLVLYDMAQKITDDQKKNLLEFLASGKGLVALHHALGSYQDWPDYQKIIGGKFYTADREEEGVLHPKSTYKHDEKLKVNIADKNHPIVQGLTDFEILDEVYNKFLVRPDVKTLLTVDHPLSAKVIAWTHFCGNAPVAYILLGHAASAFNDANYRKLVSNAIFWAAGRTPAPKAQTPAPAPARRGST